MDGQKCVGERFGPARLPFQTTMTPMLMVVAPAGNSPWS